MLATNVHCNNIYSGWSIDIGSFERIYNVYEGMNTSNELVNKLELNNYIYFYFIFYELDDEEEPVQLIDYCKLTKGEGFDEYTEYKNLTEIHIDYEREDIVGFIEN